MSHPQPINHGTYGGWATELRRGIRPCDPCRLAKNAYMREHNKRGRTRVYVDAEPIRQHIVGLVNVGLTYAEVADAAGLPKTSVTSLFGSTYNRHKRIVKENADAILSVSPSWARGSILPCYMVERRMEALMYMGWTHRDLTAAGINLPDDRFGGSTIQVSVFERWDEAYQKYSAVPGPSVKATFKAYRNDWAPAACWDEYIDDPDALPQGRPCVVWCGKEAVRRSLCIEHDLEVGEGTPSQYSSAVRRIRNQLAREAA